MNFELRGGGARAGQVAKKEMPDNKRHQAPENSFSPLLLLPEEDKPAAKELVSQEGERLDRRKHNEIRPMSLNVSINSQATGSAYLEMGRTKVLCTIYGPKEVARREDVTEEGKVTCDFKFAPFSCTKRRPYQQDQQEKTFSLMISQALQRVVDVKSFPRLQLELSVLVLENGGSALAAAMTCAGVALTETGVEMLDLPVACSVSEHTSGLLVDPSIEEEYKGDEYLCHPSVSGSVMVVYLPSLSELTTLKQQGAMTPDKLTSSIDLCVEGCTRIHQQVKDFLKDNFTKQTTSTVSSSS